MCYKYYILYLSTSAIPLDLLHEILAAILEWLLSITQGLNDTFGITVKALLLPVSSGTCRALAFGLIFRHLLLHGTVGIYLPSSPLQLTATSLGV